jgi:hypothetical protein
MTTQKASERIRDLDEVDALMIQEILKNPAITDDALVKIVRISRSRINIRRNRPTFRLAIMEYMKPTKTIIREAQPEAARALRRKLKSNDEAVVVRAASELLSPILKGDQKITVKLEMAQKVAVQISEVINKYVHDPAIRRKIADELRRLGA